MVKYTKAKLKEVRFYKKQLILRQDESTIREVKINTILSLSDEEVKEQLSRVEQEIYNYKAALKNLNEKLESAADKLDNDDENRISHIKELTSEDKIVGKKGLRLKVYENGTVENETIVFFNLHYATRGMGSSDNERKEILARLLEECANCSRLANPKTTVAIYPVPRKLFDKRGNEIKSVTDLEYDDSVWMSYGEMWKNPYTFTVGLQMAGVQIAEFKTKDHNYKTLFRQEIAQKMDAKFRLNQWECLRVIPDDLQPMYTITDKTPPDTIDSLTATLDDVEISLDHSVELFRSKENRKLILYPELTVDDKKSPTSAWPAESQIWVLVPLSEDSKEVMIECKSVRNLCLTALTVNITANLCHPMNGDSSLDISGVAVGVRTRGSGYQSWTFNTDGSVECAGRRNVFLTWLGANLCNTDVRVRSSDSKPGHMFYLALCEKLEGAMAKYQRFGIKQETMHNLGQWKNNEGVQNQQWNKQALSWPCLPDGQRNPNFDWPMEGFLMPFAPPLQDGSVGSDDSEIPKRLLVLKNGSRDVSKAVAVVPPELHNMQKPAPSKQSKKNKKLKEDDTDDTKRKLEFTLVLEQCTKALNLPFAARRLFDELGQEHFSLRELKRDQLMYVSVGENWQDPSLTKAEQQRRHLLASLESDVNQMKAYLALRAPPDDMVLQVEPPGGVGANIIINNLVTSEADKLDEGDLPALTFGEPNEDDAMAIFSKQTAHELAHKKLDEKRNQKKWPWELDLVGLEAEQAEIAHMENPLHSGRKPKKPQSRSRDLQRFLYEPEGFISLARDHQLVVSVRETEGRVLGVCLARKSQDDILQRWLMDKSGHIVSKNNPQMVLTVLMPNDMARFDGAQVTLQKIKSAECGQANQRWHFEEATGNIRAFCAERPDKEITAAIRANICTYAVMRGEEIDQPCFLADVPAPKGQKGKRLHICASCARSLRGRHPAQKINESKNFACAMGQAEKLCVKQLGSFQCLNGKVDLSWYQAEHTVAKWEDHLKTLHHKLSVRDIAKEISVAKTPTTVKLLVYKNGEGRKKPGRVIVGSSVPGLLDQATEALDLNHAARRLYTIDSTVIMDVDDLIQWVQQQHVQMAQQEIEANQKQAKVPRHQSVGSSMIDKVDMSDSEESGSDSKDKSTNKRNANNHHQESMDFKLGGSAKEDRKYTVKGQHMLLIPNPTEKIPFKGQVNRWTFSASQPGILHFLVLQPHPDANNMYTVVSGQPYTAPSKGTHTVELNCKPHPPMECNEGDVIGFYSPNDCIVKFDTEGQCSQPALFFNTPDLPSVGQAIQLQAINEKHRRCFSLNAQGLKDVGGQPSYRPKPQKKKLVKKKPGAAVPTVTIPPLPVEVILRHPIEIWVSCGEPYKPPEDVETEHKSGMEQWRQRAPVSQQLGQERHALRQMKGRRLDRQEPGEYVTTNNPVHPVYVKGHWMEPKVEELQKHDTVYQLEGHLNNVKSTQKTTVNKALNPSTTNRLYTTPSTMRVSVYLMDDSPEHCQYAWGENLEQLLDNITMLLDLRQPAKYLFTTSGRLIEDFSEIDKDQLLCVGFTKTFASPSDVEQHIEMKATWGRTRKQFGPKSTEVLVEAHPKDTINVDPFGPSNLAGGPTHPTRDTYPSVPRIKSVQPPPLALPGTIDD